MSHLRCWRVRFLLLTLVGAFTGCAIIQPTAHTQSTHVSSLSPDRREHLVRDFEKHRDEAQLGAAIDRWKQGDEPAAEALLKQLLDRNPDNREARRELADLYAARTDPTAALPHLSYLVEHDRSDAQAQHSLGLVLESVGRRSEALAHFESAVKLAPDNELYALSREECLEPE